MKMKLLAVAAAALMAAPMLHAQDTTAHTRSARAGNRVHAPMRGARRGMMMRNLNLTADQQSRMKAIRDKYAPRMKATREATRPDMDAMRSARAKHDTTAMRTAREKLRSDMAPNRNLMKEQMAEMRAVLTPEQQQKVDSARTRMRNRARVRGARPGNGFRSRLRHAPAPARPDSTANLGG